MAQFNRDTLVKINYLLVGSLLIGSVLVVMFVASPEKMIVGQWKEVAWSFDKPDYRVDESNFARVLEHHVRREILDKLEILHVDKWIFKSDGTLVVNESSTADMTWSIKGRGHILEIRRNGKFIESFQIQTLSATKMELHLNLDIQVKGIIKIILEKEEKGEDAHAA